MYKKVSIIVSILVIVIIIYFIIARKPKPLIITAIKEAYNQVSLIGEKEKIGINLYFNQKNPSIIAKTKIIDASLSDYYKETVISAKVTDILFMGDIFIESEKFYCYQYVLETIDLYDNIEIEDVYLHIRFYHFDDLFINIGSISIYKTEQFASDEMRITNLKGIVNEINGKKILVGIILSITNLTNNKIIIEEIKPLDLNLSCAGAIDINGKVIASNQAIDLLLGYPYDLNQEAKKLNLELLDDVHLLIPLSYKNHYEISNCGLKIIYYIYDKEKVIYYDDFQYFINHQRYIDINELIFYHYENY